jgi:hypothetical protein
MAAQPDSPMTPDAQEAVRAARHQSLFRDVNERIEELNEQFSRILPMGDWVCECADEECFEPIELTMDEYEAIREHPARFPVLPGHELTTDVEVVVETHERYLVVEKKGTARDVAIEHDKRSRKQQE